MNASDLFKSGKLTEAIAAQTQEVKAHPADQNKRLFLFELLAFAGDLDRARKQLDVLRFDQLELEAAAQSYRKLLDAEEKRRLVFTQGAHPEFLHEPGGHVALRLGALNFLRDGQPQEASQLLAKANADAPCPSGKLNGKPFDLLRDADDRFGPVLEVFAQGNYYWVPLEQIEAVMTKPPRLPRDVLWLPARLETKASSGEVFLPTLYPGSHDHADDLIKLGRANDWQTVAGGAALGIGLRLFLAGDEGVSLADCRDLQLNP